MAISNLISKTYRAVKRRVWSHALTEADKQSIASYSRIFGRAPKAIQNGGSCLFSYTEDGKPNFDAYKKVQSDGNKAKLHQVFVNPDNIRALCGFIGSANSVLCHGTRNGAEQRFFKAVWPSATVLGTEISDTATQFPDTIEWDFHELKPEWRGAWDVVYSNSWDHALDPRKMLDAWIESLAPHGWLVLEHTRFHEPDFSSPLDPFGATVAALTGLMREVGGERLGEPAIREDLPFRFSGQKFVMARRR